jgi:predicted nicotinamide N-methyase
LEMGVAGLRVIELGCGIGLPGIVAALEGASVTMTDWYEDALVAAQQNARGSGARVETRLLDWRSPPPDLSVRPFDLVMAADVLYEARNAEWLAALLPQLVARNAEVIIADPRRPDAQTLVDAMVGRGWAHTRTDHPVRGRVDESGPVIHIHRLRPAI